VSTSGVDSDVVAAVGVERTYVAARGPQGVANLTFYQAATCLQFGEYLVRRQIRESEKIEAMLDEGLRILGQAN